MTDHSPTASAHSGLADVVSLRLAADGTSNARSDVAVKCSPTSPIMDAKNTYGSPVPLYRLRREELLMATMPRSPTASIMITESSCRACAAPYCRPRDGTDDHHKAVVGERRRSASAPGAETACRGSTRAYRLWRDGARGNFTARGGASQHVANARGTRDPCRSQNRLYRALHEEHLPEGGPSAGADHRCR